MEIGPMSKSIAFQLDAEIARKLEQLAASLDRPQAWLIEQAILRYIEDETWQAQEIADALNTYRVGEATLTPHEQVMDRLNARIRDRQ
jgi:predicted transcriptional regulator